jgi:hypothetical protein
MLFRIELQMFRTIVVILAFILVTGCASHKKASDASPASAPSDENSEDQSTVPEAKIHISYSHAGDYLSSMVVTKYDGADTLRTGTSPEGSTATVRFTGGVVVWQFSVEKAFLSGMPLIGGKQKPYAPNEVKYGLLPEHFVATIPDNGAPETLEPDHYYVFMVTRGSGSVSYQAVKVNGDGSLEGYVADPRAGDSYQICCNIAADFTLTPPIANPPLNQLSP